MKSKQYEKTVRNLSTMTVSELWEHYAKLCKQPMARTLEHRCITLGELEKRGVRGFMVDGELVTQ